MCPHEAPPRLARTDRNKLHLEVQMVYYCGVVTNLTSMHGTICVSSLRPMWANYPRLLLHWPLRHRGSAGSSPSRR